MTTLTLTDIDQSRQAILSRLTAGTISNSQACTLLCVSTSAVYRLSKHNLAIHMQMTQYPDANLLTFKL